jgi:predicted NUDIX family NTP pyrophosphohydrolase
MPRRSAGILLYRRRQDALEVLLVHPGGPAWAKRDAGAWSIPKGEYGDGEDPRAVALREFEEETGRPPPTGELVALGEIRQRGGKLVTAWATPGDLDPEKVTSNTFKMQWPPRSGQCRLVRPGHGQGEAAARPGRAGRPAPGRPGRTGAGPGEGQSRLR